MNYQVGDYVSCFSYSDQKDYIGRVTSIDVTPLKYGNTIILGIYFPESGVYISLQDTQIDFVASKDNHLAKLLK